jgi:cytochrome c oxidase subunit IV
MNLNINYAILVYVLVVVGFGIFSALCIYHLRRFGYAGDLTKPVILIYSVVSVAIIVASFFGMAYFIMRG